MHLSMHELQTRNVQVIDTIYSRESERLPNMVKTIHLVLSHQICQSSSAVAFTVTTFLFCSDTVFRAKNFPLNVYLNNKCISFFMSLA